MKKRIDILWYTLIFFAIIIIDRFTKSRALDYCFDRVAFTSFFSCDLVLNRGISWGMFHSQSNIIFLFVSVLISAFIIVLGFYTYRRFKENQSIVGETFVLAGACSNMIDRVLYAGVIDFLVFSWGSWSWPAFNCADFFIVFGIILMLFESFRHQ